jgi:hypothetical protein
MDHRARWTGLGAVVILLAACTGSPSADPSSSAVQSSGTNQAAGPFPAGCDPIELRAPDGSLVVLDGPWVDAEPPDTGGMTWWFRALGDCVWGVGTAEGWGPVQNLRGTLRSDFTIDSEIAFLGQQQFFGSQIAPLTQVRLLIEFEDGEVILSEDRASGTGGPRCPDFNNCIPPLVLIPDQLSSP